jgi:hypothetical protein
MLPHGSGMVEWTAPDGIEVCQSEVVEVSNKGAVHSTMPERLADCGDAERSEDLLPAQGDNASVAFPAAMRSGHSVFS